MTQSTGPLKILHGNLLKAFCTFIFINICVSVLNTILAINGSLALIQGFMNKRKELMY